MNHGATRHHLTLICSTLSVTCCTVDNARQGRCNEDDVLTQGRGLHDGGGFGFFLDGRRRGLLFSSRPYPLRSWVNRTRC